MFRPLPFAGALRLRFAKTGIASKEARLLLS